MEIKRKVVLLGDAAVGKTSLVRRFVFDAFDDKYIMTIGTKVSKKTIDLVWDNIPIKLNLMIWDVLGQQGFTQVQETAFKGSDGALIVCDLTRKNTLYSIAHYWLPTLERVAGVPAILLANKKDLDNWELTYEEVENFANQIGVPFVLTSAKTGENVEEAFRKLAEMTFIFYPIVVNETSLKDIKTVKDALDYIMDDFCKKYGNYDDGMAVLTANLKLVGINIEKPTVPQIIALIDKLYTIEKDYMKLQEAQNSRIRRLGLLKKVRWS